MNAHAAFRNLGESLIRSWVTPLMFSDCGDWEAEAKRRVCRLLSGLRATVTAVSIVLPKGRSASPGSSLARGLMSVTGIAKPEVQHQFLPRGRRVRAMASPIAYLPEGPFQD